MATVGSSNNYSQKLVRLQENNSNKEETIRESLQDFVNLSTEDERNKFINNLNIKADKPKTSALILAKLITIFYDNIDQNIPRDLNEYEFPENITTAFDNYQKGNFQNGNSHISGGGVFSRNTYNTLHLWLFVQELSQKHIQESSPSITMRDSISSDDEYKYDDEYKNNAEFHTNSTNNIVHTSAVVKISPTAILEAGIAYLATSGNKGKQKIIDQLFILITVSLMPKPRTGEIDTKLLVSFIEKYANCKRKTSLDILESQLSKFVDTVGLNESRKEENKIILRTKKYSKNIEKGHGWSKNEYDFNELNRVFNKQITEFNKIKADRDTKINKINQLITNKINQFDNPNEQLMPQITDDMTIGQMTQTIQQYQSQLDQLKRSITQLHKKLEGFKAPTTDLNTNTYEDKLQQAQTNLQQMKDQMQLYLTNQRNQAVKEFNALLEPIQDFLFKYDTTPDENTTAKELKDVLINNQIILQQVEPLIENLKQQAKSIDELGVQLSLPQQTKIQHQFMNIDTDIKNLIQQQQVWLSNAVKRERAATKIQVIIREHNKKLKSVEYLISHPERIATISNDEFTQIRTRLIAIAVRDGNEQLISALKQKTHDRLFDLIVDLLIENDQEMLSAFNEIDNNKLKKSIIFAGLLRARSDSFQNVVLGQNTKFRWLYTQFPTYFDDSDNNKKPIYNFVHYLFPDDSLTYIESLVDSIPNDKFYGLIFNITQFISNPSRNKLELIKFLNSMLNGMNVGQMNPLIRFIHNFFTTQEVLTTDDNQHALQYFINEKEVFLAEEQARKNEEIARKSHSANTIGTFLIASTNKQKIEKLKIQQELERQQKMAADMAREIANKQDAATIIQTLFRGHNVRKQSLLQPKEWTVDELIQNPSLINKLTDEQFQIHHNQLIMAAVDSNQESLIRALNAKLGDNGFVIAVVNLILSGNESIGKAIDNNHNLKKMAVLTYLLRTPFQFNKLFEDLTTELLKSNDLEVLSAVMSCSNTKFKITVMLKLIKNLNHEETWLIYDESFQGFIAYILTDAIRIDAVMSDTQCQRLRTQQNNLTFLVNRETQIINQLKSCYEQLHSSLLVLLNQNERLKLSVLLKTQVPNGGSSLELDPAKRSLLFKNQLDVTYKLLSGLNTEYHGTVSIELGKLINNYFEANGFNTEHKQQIVNLIEKLGENFYSGRLSPKILPNLGAHLVRLLQNTNQQDFLKVIRNRSVQETSDNSWFRGRFDSFNRVSADSRIFVILLTNEMDLTLVFQVLAEFPKLAMNIQVDSLVTHIIQYTSFHQDPNPIRDKFLTSLKNGDLNDVLLTINKVVGDQIFEQLMDMLLAHFASAEWLGSMPVDLIKTLVPSRNEQIRLHVQSMLLSAPQGFITTYMQLLFKRQFYYINVADCIIAICKKENGDKYNDQKAIILVELFSHMQKIKECPELEPLNTKLRALILRVPNAINYVTHDYWYPLFIKNNSDLTKLMTVVTPKTFERLIPHIIGYDIYNAISQNNRRDIVEYLAQQPQLVKSIIKADNREDCLVEINYLLEIYPFCIDMLNNVLFDKDQSIRHAFFSAVTTMSPSLIIQTITYIHNSKIVADFLCNISSYHNSQTNTITTVEEIKNRIWKEVVVNGGRFDLRKIIPFNDPFRFPHTDFVNLEVDQLPQIARSGLTQQSFEFYLTELIASANLPSQKLKFQNCCPVLQIQMH